MKLASSPILTDNKMIVSAEQLKIALRRMGKTLSVLPLTYLDKPMMPQSSWPDYNQWQTSVASEFRRSTKPKANPREISNAEYWLAVIIQLEVSQRRIVMARAMGITWRRLEEMDGRSHTTLRKVELAALHKMLILAKPENKP